MNGQATIANLLWITSNVPDFQKFHSALAKPAETQAQVLKRILSRNETTLFGQCHQFSRIRSYNDFARHVPLQEYDRVEPWIARVQSGEKQVLTSSPVTHLIPTSGSTSARKLIPFTSDLQTEFNCAIAPWISKTAFQYPSILLGPSYWSISPPPVATEATPSQVPIGFGHDSDYLGGKRSQLIQSALVTPRSVPRGCSLNTFQYETLAALLRARELRLISVWHPSFLTLLLDAIPQHWDAILSDLSRRDRVRYAELKSSNPLDPLVLWPHLKVVSCWGDSTSLLPMRQLQQRLATVTVQPKGLLATEACVTIPWHTQHPIALRSHFFEFIDTHGNILRAHELHLHETYEVVVTTGGGLYRYRLGDRVRVKSFVRQTPSLEFIGRSAKVSDLFGEKLSEDFVNQVLLELFPSRIAPPLFTLLAPHSSHQGWHYRLFLEGSPPPQAAERLESLLLQNPHYQICRQLGQLSPADVCQVPAQAYARYAERFTRSGTPLGNIKPSTLSTQTDWNDFLT